MFEDRHLRFLLFGFTIMSLLVVGGIWGILNYSPRPADLEIMERRKEQREKDARSRQRPPAPSAPLHTDRPPTAAASPSAGPAKKRGHHDGSQHKPTAEHGHHDGSPQKRAGWPVQPRSQHSDAHPAHQTSH